MPRVIVNYWFAALLFVATLFALSSWGAPLPKTLTQAAAQMQADLKLEEAPAAQDILPKSIRFAAPANWWSLLEPPQVDYRGRNGLIFRWAPQQVAWLWTGELCLRKPEAENYRRHIREKMSVLGFAEIDASLTSSLAMQGIYNSDRFCFSKVSNFTREAAVFELGPFTGGSDSGFQAGGRCNWSAALDCQVPAPTLRELVIAMPLLRPPHVLPEWEAILNDQTVYEVHSDFFLSYSPRVNPSTSWGVTIAASNQPLLEATLEAAGFIKDRPRSTDIDRLDLDGNKLGHQGWSRNSDSWFIHFDTTSATPDRVHFRVQSPQRKR